MTPKININGTVREMTEDEAVEMERITEDFSMNDLSADERMTQIEAALIELAALLTGGDVDG